MSVSQVKMTVIINVTSREFAPLQSRKRAHAHTKEIQTQIYDCCTFTFVF